jgi:hypothetical protein
MKSMWRGFFALLSMSLLLGGCGGGGGGSSNVSPADPAPTNTTLTTTLALTEEQPAAANLQATTLSVRAAAVQAATVTLTLPDGTTYTMADNGSGGYSCTVKDFPTGSPFVINAHAGDLVLKNFFDGLQSADGEIDLGETNPKTTLFVDLLATFAGALDVNLNFPTAQQLLQAVKDAALTIDLVTLKAQVNDDNDAVFAQVRQTYQTVLSWGNLNGETSSETLIAEAGTLTTVVTEITTGGVLPPVAGSDVDVVRPLLAQLYLAYLTGDADALAATLGTEGFLWSGQNAEEFLAGMTTDEEFADATDVILVKGGGTVEPGPEPNSWWLYGSGEFTYTIAGIDHWLQFDDKKQAFEGLPMLVKKDAEGRFAIYGNQKKTETWGHISYVREENSRNCSGQTCQVNPTGSTSIGFGVGIADTTGYPVSSASISGSAFSQSFSLANQPGDDSNERGFWAQYKGGDGVLSTNVWLYNETTDQWGETPITWTAPLEGSKLTVNIAFANGEPETRTFVVPTAVTPAYPSITGVTGNSDGTVTVNWTDISDNMPGGAGLAVFHVEIVDDTQGGWYEIMELDELAPGTSSVTVPAGQMVAGQIYMIRVAYEDIYGREFESRRYFMAPEGGGEPSPPASFPFTDILLDGKSFTNAWDDSDTGEHTEETITFTGTGGQYTVTVRDQTFDAAGTLIDDTTDTVTGGIQSDGTFRADFPEPDPDSGATYAILTLLADNTGSITIRFTEFNAANAQLFTDTETWQKL